MAFRKPSIPAASGLRAVPASGSESGRAARWSLVLVLAATLASPLALRLVNRLIPNTGVRASYIASVEPPRERLPFNADAPRDIRSVDPDYVVIGDSMAGSRIDHRRLGDLVGGHGVVPIIEPGTGSVYWYLAFKNWVVAGGARPKAVVFFFRDANLTDPLFRINPALVDRVALEQEPRLNDILAARSQGAFFRLHALARSAYGFDRTRQWIEPLVARAPLELAVARQAREHLLDRMNERIFTLAALRPTASADMDSEPGGLLDFPSQVETSVLPEIVRLGRESRTRLGFIRVQRRPVGGRPPAQSPALREYVRRLRAYLEANGAYFHDEWGDPELPESIYSDGDHVGGRFRVHCTDLLYRRNPGLFR